MKDKYVLDSSIWIDWERGKPDVLTLVEPLVQKNQICLVDVIAVEVLRGVKNKKDYLILKKAFEDFVVLSTTWWAVEALAHQVAKKGYLPNLVDLYIAQSVIENNKTLITSDAHFNQIAQAKHFPLIYLKR